MPPRNPAPEPAWTQLSLTGDTAVDHFVRDEVLAINPAHTTNGQRVRDLARLGYLIEPVLDPTYGYGSMWSEYRPEELWIGDANPARVGHASEAAHDFRDMPYANRFFGSCLYDPPYRFAGTPTDVDEGGHDDYYGTDVYRTKAEQLQLILDGAEECARVTEHYLIVKCQDQVVADAVGWQTRTVTDHVEARHFVLKDSLHLLSYRAQPAGRSQQNARRNYSTFLVFLRRC